MSYTIRSIDDLPAKFHGVVRLAGAELGVESFGLQVLDLPPNFTDYPAHDHAEDGQEEVYVVLRGAAEAEVDGERMDFAAGQILWVGAGTRRGFETGSEGVRLLVIGATPGRLYERPDDFRLEEARS